MINLVNNIDKTEIKKFSFSAMGTECNIYLYDSQEISIEDIVELVIEEVERIEEKYSRYRSDSYLSKINEAAMKGGKFQVDDETASLLDYSFACFKLSDGLFDISSGILRKVWNFKENKLPNPSELNLLLKNIGMHKIKWNNPHLEFTTKGMEIDFGGIGKEYAVDRSVSICKSNGVKYGLIDFGGDLKSIGAPQDNPWFVNIRNPKNNKESIVKIQLTKGALVTSGNYERFIEVDDKKYSHILNPLTGYSTDFMQSVSVLSDDCLLAGTLSTIAILKNELCIDWLNSKNVNFYCINKFGEEFSNNITFV